MNNKSLDYIKTRLNDNTCGITEKSLNKAVVLKYIDVLNEIDNFKELSDKEYIQLVLSGDGNDKRNVLVKYDPNANFEYFTTSSCTCDGTLYFINTLTTEILNSVFLSQTYNKKVSPEKYKDNLWKYDIKYTVGDFIFVDEQGDFGTKEKPWLHSKFTVMLPLICRILEK